MITVMGLTGIGEVSKGDDVAAIILRALESNKVDLGATDIVVVTQKIVSKAEGRVVKIDESDPTAKHRIVEGESRRIVRRRGGLTISETRHGFVCANAGVDSSNVGESETLLCLLPRDPDLSARRIRAKLKAATGVATAVIISDTFGRAWRNGQTNVAIGVAGMSPLKDYRGTPDDYGHLLHVTSIAVADEVAGAAELVMGKTERVPVAVVRGVSFEAGDGQASSLVRNSQDDLFR